MASAKSIIGLLLNIFILPGLGTIINGKVKNGIIQMVLVLVGYMFLFFGLFAGLISPSLAFISFVGFPMVMGAWIWALIDGIMIIKRESAAQVPVGSRQVTAQQTGAPQGAMVQSA